MISLLAKWLIPHRENMADAAVRRAYGQLCGMVGIALNVLLFAGKFFAGTISGSIAVTADAFNNLSDAGSSVVTLLGFRLAGRKPDPEHPFGHGRMEYLSGLVVSALILLMGVELGKSSIDKILHPQPLEAGILPDDLVVVHQQQAVRNGDIVVALFEDEATVKTYRRENGHVWLYPENSSPEYQPIDGEGCSILGKVIAVIRRY